MSIEWKVYCRASREDELEEIFRDIRISFYLLFFIYELDSFSLGFYILFYFLRHAGLAAYYIYQDH
jgi:hypothetical protein